MKFPLLFITSALTALLSMGCESPSSLRSARQGNPLAGSGAPVTMAEERHVEEGKMSWISVRTNGGTKTASGETFADQGATAAHRTLPFGTMVKVTNLDNDLSAIVRINDRGPYSKERVIDVSIGTAERLQFVRSGVAPCRIEVVDDSVGIPAAPSNPSAAALVIEAIPEVP